MLRAQNKRRKNVKMQRREKVEPPSRETKNDTRGVRHLMGPPSLEDVVIQETDRKPTFDEVAPRAVKKTQRKRKQEPPTRETKKPRMTLCRHLQPIPS